MKSRKPAVQIYGWNQCSLCKRAIELAEQFDLTYEYIDVMMSNETQIDFQTKFPDVNVVPQIIWNDKKFTLNEFSSEIYNTRNYGDGEI